MNPKLRRRVATRPHPSTRLSECPDTINRDHAAAKLSVIIISRVITEIVELREISRLIERRGFDILDHFDLNGREATIVGSILSEVGVQQVCKRPGRAFVTLDLCPIPVTEEQRRLIPGLDNARLLKRDSLNRASSFLLKRGNKRRVRHYNFSDKEVHLATTNNSSQAWEIIGTLVPERMNALRREVDARIEAFRTPFPVIRSLTAFGNNARVDVVNYQGELAVCKVFRPGRQRYFENELAGLRLSKKIPQIPRLLAYGPNWVLTPYYEDAVEISDTANVFGLIPLSHAEDTFRALRRIHEAGYAHLDFHPAHVLVDRQGKVRLIDFDRFHKYTKQAPAFQECPSITGYSTEPLADIPNGRFPTHSRVWYPLIGLNIRNLLHAGSKWQQIRRCVYILERPFRYATRAVWGGVIRMVRRLLSTYGFVDADRIKIIAARFKIPLSID